MMQGRQPRGLIARINQFFKDNPDEELTYADLAAKFGVSPETAHRRVSDAVREGEPIESVHVIRAKRSAVT